MTGITGASGAAEYGPVASGETLWGIARDWSAGTGLDINQVMIAIQRVIENAEQPGAVEPAEKLADRILSLWPDNDVDVVMPVPDTSRTAAVREELERRDRRDSTRAHSPLTRAPDAVLVETGAGLGIGLGFGDFGLRQTIGPVD